MQLVTNSFNSYYDNLPSGVAEAAAKGFAYCFAVTVLFVVASNPEVSIPAVVALGLRVGTVSALATLVHAATAPVFRLLTNAYALSLPLEMFRRGIAWYITALIASLHPALRINLFATVVIGSAYMIINGVINGITSFGLGQPALFFPFLANDAVGTAPRIPR